MAALRPLRCNDSDRSITVLSPSLQSEWLDSMQDGQDARTDERCSKGSVSWVDNSLERIPLGCIPERMKWPSPGVWVSARCSAVEKPPLWLLCLLVWTGILTPATPISCCAAWARPWLQVQCKAVIPV
eukprot:284129-Pelagomonas_calceolata.AAC.3